MLKFNSVIIGTRKHVVNEFTILRSWSHVTTCSWTPKMTKEVCVGTTELRERKKAKQTHNVTFHSLWLWLRDKKRAIAVAKKLHNIASCEFPSAVVKMILPEMQSALTVVAIANTQ